MKIPFGRGQYPVGAKFPVRVDLGLMIKSATPTFHHAKAAVAGHRTTGHQFGRIILALGKMRELLQAKANVAYACHEALPKVRIVWPAGVAMPGISTGFDDPTGKMRQGAVVRIFAKMGNNFGIIGGTQRIRAPA